MALNTSQAARQVGTFFRSLTARQRTTLGASTALVGLALYGFVWLMGRGEYQTLYVGLAEGEGITLVEHLSARGISGQLSGDGTTLSVPAGNAEKARLALAAEGLPHTGHLGFELFDKPNWAGSDFVEQVNYQRALEGELDRTIEAMSGVEAARVHVAMVRESLYTEEQHDAKAAVLVKLLPGFRLSDNDLNAIAFLVSSAVDNMKPEDVRVIDTDGHVPLLSHGGAHSNEAQDEETELSQKLIDTLGAMVGPSHVRASVTVEFESGSNESTQETYDPNASAVLASQTTGDSTSVVPPSQGVPGSASNVPQTITQQPPKAPTPSPQLAGLRSDNRTFAVSKTIRHNVQPPGGIRKLSAAIVVDDAIDTSVQNKKTVETRRKRTPDEMKQLASLAAAAIGINPARGDAIAVENMSFVSSDDTLAAPTLAQRVPSMINQYLPALRYGGLAIALGLMYLLVLKPLKKQLSQTFQALPAPSDTVAAATTSGAPQAALGSAGARPQLPESPVTGRTATLTDLLSQKVTSEPVQTSRLVEDWLRQG
jgi:flagellar M-ring protein FliF